MKIQIREALLLLGVIIIASINYQCQESKEDPILLDQEYLHKASDTEVLNRAEIMPLFSGCDGKGVTDPKSCSDRKMLQYIYTNVKYPAIARKNNEEGQVIIGFVIQKNGQVENVKVIRDTGSGELGKEASRVVKTMPRWTPGMQDGKHVNVNYTLPVKFQLE